MKDANASLLISSTLVGHLLAEIRDARPRPAWLPGPRVLGRSAGSRPGLLAGRTAPRPAALRAGMARAWLAGGRPRGGPLW